MLSMHPFIRPSGHPLSSAPRSHQSSSISHHLHEEGTDQR